MHTMLWSATENPTSSWRNARGTRWRYWDGRRRSRVLERLYCPNTSAASIRTWVGWALGWAPLDMHASGIWAAVQGAHLKPLFGKPPRLPENHRWVFALIDAGVPSDLSASSPTFLMAPGQDVLHGTMCTGKADGTDHVEHGAGGSALMNKRKLTSDTARKYRASDLARERRSIG